MGFWIYMLCMSLMIPITMIGFGSFFAKKAPEKINSLFGYRTALSMKNKDTWTFAHTHSGKLWRVVGWIMLPLSIGTMLLLLEKDAAIHGTYGGMLILIQCVVLVVSIVPTQRALKKHFDEHGNRKE